MSCYLNQASTFYCLFLSSDMLYTTVNVFTKNALGIFCNAKTLVLFYDENDLEIGDIRILTVGLALTCNRG